MHKFLLPFFTAFILTTTPTQASEFIKSYVPKAQKVGEGRLSVMFWDVYDAHLYAPEGQWEQNGPFALKLSYLRDIKGKKIADRSIEEMRHQGFNDEVKLADWHALMRNIFPNVYEGTTLTGVMTEDGQCVFLKNGNEIGRIKDTEFSKYFFGIWLSDKTNAPNLRQKLLGSL